MVDSKFEFGAVSKRLKMAIHKVSWHQMDIYSMYMPNFVRIRSAVWPEYWTNGLMNFTIFPLVQYSGRTAERIATKFGMYFEYISIWGQETLCIAIFSCLEMPAKLNLNYIFFNFLISRHSVLVQDGDSQTLLSTHSSVLDFCAKCRPDRCCRFPETEDTRGYTHTHTQCIRTVSRWRLHKSLPLRSCVKTALLDENVMFDMNFRG
jgi:hypothetical protein